jgi:hypothetical protein
MSSERRRFVELDQADGGTERYEVTDEKGFVAGFDGFRERLRRNGEIIKAAESELKRGHLKWSAGGYSGFHALDNALKTAGESVKEALKSGENSQEVASYLDHLGGMLLDAYRLVNYMKVPLNRDPGGSGRPLYLKREDGGDLMLLQERNLDALERGPEAGRKKAAETPYI